VLSVWCERVKCESVEFESMECESVKFDVGMWSTIGL
jgi:hypothetical protein